MESQDRNFSLVETWVKKSTTKPQRKESIQLIKARYWIKLEVRGYPWVIPLFFKSLEIV